MAEFSTRNALQPRNMQAIGVNMLTSKRGMAYCWGMKVETWQNPMSFATNSIRYFVKDGRHVIVHSMTCGEDIAPNIYRFDAIESARAMWRQIRALINSRGYTQKRTP